MDSLRGKLLIAAPSQYDYFRRTVVLVLEHGEDGAMGVVLNRPSETVVGDAVPALSGLAGEGELVRIGGPVAPEAVVALAEFPDPEEASTQVLEGVGVLDPEAPNESLGRLRVYAGYAGWAPGQLDAELEQGAWIVERAEPGDPFADEDIWPEVVRRKGGSYSLMARMPADPSLN